MAQFFATAETEAEYGDLSLWVAKHSAPPPRRGNDGITKFWIELDNAYVKAGAAAALPSLGAPTTVQPPSNLPTCPSVRTHARHDCAWGSSCSALPNFLLSLSL